MKRRLLIDPRELVAKTGINPYLALPREEIEHFFAVVPLTLAAETDAVTTYQGIPIAAVVVLNHNYNWMVFDRSGEDEGELILGLRSDPFRDETAPLFLDKDFLNYTRAFLDDTLTTPDPITLKMAGMYLETGFSGDPACLNLVCVAQMRQKKLHLLDSALCFHQTMGTGELTGQVHRFDPLSRFLISKLYGF